MIPCWEKVTQGIEQRWVWCYWLVVTLQLAWWITKYNRWFHTSLSSYPLVRLSPTFWILYSVSNKWWIQVFKDVTFIHKYIVGGKTALTSTFHEYIYSWNVECIRGRETCIDFHIFSIFFGCVHTSMDFLLHTCFFYLFFMSTFIDLLTVS